MISVPYTPTGPDLERFAEVLAAHRPRLYITNSAIHNPTSATLSPVVAHRLLKLAEQAGLTIVEDDIFADFEHVPAPRFAAFDGLDRVVQIGSYSKTLSASMRCGFIAAPRDWIEGLTDLKVATTFGGPNLAAELVFTMLKDGSYRKHMEALRQRLARAMADTAGRLTDIGIKPWIEPQAGMFLWCRLPEGSMRPRWRRRRCNRRSCWRPAMSSATPARPTASCASMFPSAKTSGFSRSCLRSCANAALRGGLSGIARQRQLHFLEATAGDLREGRPISASPICFAAESSSFRLFFVHGASSLR